MVGLQKDIQLLNKSGIKTLRGKNWLSSSVISVLKRKHERDLINNQIRNQHFLSKVSLNYLFCKTYGTKNNTRSRMWE